MLIERPPLLYRLFYPDAVFRVPGEKKVAYLTFDDGPIPEATPWVLDVLDSYRVKATFFMVGDNVRKYPHLYEEVIRRGHKVGNHTMHHLQGLKVTTEEYLSDIAIAADYIKSRLFRPPHGRIKFSQIRNLKKNFKIVAWTVISYDWDKSLSPDDCYENVIKNASDGSIVVFHDSEKAVNNMIPALTKVLEYYTDKGYTFEKLGIGNC